MPKVRGTILLSFAGNMIDAMECLLLYDAHSPQNPDIPYWSYERFNLDLMTDDECKTEFRFYKNDIYDLSEVLNIPYRYNSVNADRTEAFCVFLKKFAYPCRYVDLIPRFARPEPQLCMMSNAVMNSICTSWRHLLLDLNQPCLGHAHLQTFTEVINEKGVVLQNCWGFIDGTVRPISCLGRNQCVMYNGHKKVHSIKFQSIATPNSLIANLYDLGEGKRHDSAMLALTSGVNSKAAGISWLFFGEHQRYKFI